MTAAATDRRPFLTARWEHVLMLTWEVDASRLAGWLPAGTELDRHGGAVFASLVGFRFLDTRVLGVPVPGHRDFPEVNLRYYVRRRAADGWRRGVAFLREVVPRRAIAWVARWAYGERYVARAMACSVRPPDGGSGGVRYAWREGRERCALQAGFHGAPTAPPPGSLEGFLVEHYWGYARRSAATTLEYRVEHPPWRTWAATGAALEGTPPGPLAGQLEGAPVSALVAEGSPVIVHRPARIRP